MDATTRSSGTQILRTPLGARALPGAALRSLLVYNLFFPLAFLAILPGVLRRTLRRGNYRENFRQRLGRYSDEDRARLAQGRWVWIHSISVGETLVALKLARQLHQNQPALQIVVSVTTSTGWALAASNPEPWLAVIYNPLDRPAIVRGALDTLRPEQVIFIEGEAWPNLLAQCYARSIPTALVNARLSPRSEARFQCVRFWTAPIFNLLDQICVPEASDLARWHFIGIDRSRLRHTGSLKFDLAAGALGSSRSQDFRALLGSVGVPPGAPVIVAGSTWGPEELVLARSLPAWRRLCPNLFLVLVPRHVERTPVILAELAPTGLRVCRRSALPLKNVDPFDILLVDTTGELRDWYELATLVFVGKSMPGIADVGGQNPAEPAALGKAVVFGPHMENFEAVVELLKGQSAVRQVADEESLSQCVAGLLADPGLRAELGQRAVSALSVHQGATARAAALL